MEEMSMYKYLRQLMDIAEKIGAPDSVFMGDNYVSVDGHCKVYKEDIPVTFSINLSFREEKKDGD
jgi:hypothetical protein